MEVGVVYYYYSHIWILMYNTDCWMRMHAHSHMKRVLLPTAYFSIMYLYIPLLIIVRVDYNEDGL